MVEGLLRPFFCLAREPAQEPGLSSRDELFPRARVFLPISIDAFSLPTGICTPAPWHCDCCGTVGPVVLAGTS
jgi:hypothetical protein